MVSVVVNLHNKFYTTKLTAHLIKSHNYYSEMISKLHWFSLRKSISFCSYNQFWHLEFFMFLGLFTDFLKLTRVVYEQ